MRRDRPFYLRVLWPLVAIGIGILGQTTAAAATPMQMSQEVVGVSHLAAASDHCAGCLGQSQTPACPAVAPACASLFCSALPAVLPVGPIVATSARASFDRSDFFSRPGITVRPDLGPPRPVHRI